MKRAFLSTSLILLTILLAVAGCRSGGGAAAQNADQQRAFGVRMARMNLWREAMFRFQRAVQMNPDDAMAHNNLAVAYEANGQFDKAEEEYRAAMKLDRSNEWIQKNYSRLREFSQRNKRREQKKPATATTAATSTAPAAAPTDAAPAAPAAPTAPASTPAPPPSPAPTGAAPANVPTPTPPATNTAAPPPPTPPVLHGGSQ